MSVVIETRRLDSRLNIAKLGEREKEHVCNDLDFILQTS